MTEEEAKTKWCPAASVRHWTRPMRDEDALCIASKCMAWRQNSRDNGRCGLAGDS